MVIKTRAECVAALTDAILEMQHYEAPEVIALPIEDGAGNPAYLQWLLDESGG